MMLYPKLRSLKIYKEEIKHWKKAIHEAKKANFLTKVGERKLNSIPELKKRLEEAEKEYEAIKEDLLNNQSFQNMEPYLQDACKEYYFEGKKDIDTNYSGENLLRDVRNYCHKLK